MPQKIFSQPWKKVKTMARTINSRVSWVGKIDWELNKFHGEELSTRHGSSYNAYLVKGTVKTVLIDTVWKPYGLEFIEQLKQTINLSEITAIVANHGEVDHSGALPFLLKLIPGTPVYCTANGVKSLKGQYHEDWNFQVVKTGDRLELGGCDLTFIEAPMLHWPDTMFSYLSQDNILFSNDAFGQHYASEKMFNDLVDQCELMHEAMKYYANILSPYSAMVIKKVREILDMGLPVDMICPSHGVIWREEPMRIVDKYRQWADNYHENQVTVLYDTMWNSTRIMAEAIAAAMADYAPALCVKVYNVSKHDHSDLVTEVFRSRGIVVGSPTYNRGLLSAMAAVLEEIGGMGLKNRKAVAFGSYGWSGEAAKIIAEHLGKAGFELINDGLRHMWTPDQEALAKCRFLGEEFTKALD